MHYHQALGDKSSSHSNRVNTISERRKKNRNFNNAFWLVIIVGAAALLMNTDEQRQSQVLCPGYMRLRINHKREVKRIADTDSCTCM